MQERIWCFSSPTRAVAEAHPKGHFNWMRAGAELFRCLERDRPLYAGGPVADDARLCFETFPHAATCALRGEVASARDKRKDRLALVTQAGINLPQRPVMDTIDAALCALAAAGNAAAHFLFFGFLPAQSAARRRELEGLKALPYLLVFYEAPHRVAASVAEMAEVLMAPSVPVVGAAAKPSLGAAAASVAASLLWPSLRSL
mgnify:CR=1 FL=1